MFVARTDGAIIGAYESPQPDKAEEWLDESNPELQAFLAGFANLEQAKATKISEINSRANQEYFALTSSYPTLEPHKWSYTLEEAQALIVADPVNYTTVAPNLVLEATVRQIDPLTHAQTVVAKSQAYRQRCAQIAGNRGRHTDAISQLTTIAAVVEYDYSQGWE